MEAERYECQRCRMTFEEVDKPRYKAERTRCATPGCLLSFYHGVQKWGGPARCYVLKTDVPAVRG